MRTIFATAAILIGSCLLSPIAFADGNCGEMTTVQFMRDDVSTLKKHMQDIVTAMPMPDAPYGRENENWQLPSYACQDDMGIRPVDISYTSRYSVEATLQQKNAAFQKQIMEAQAKGDYEAMTNINQQVAQQAMQQAALSQANAPVDISVAANTSDSGTIDPDAVVSDGQGFLAIRTSTDSTSNTENVSVYFDPVALKDAHQLASFDMGGDYRVHSKLDLYSLRIDLEGPAKVVDKMVRGIDSSKVLSGLTTSRTNVESTD